MPNPSEEQRKVEDGSNATERISKIAHRFLFVDDSATVAMTPESRPLEGDRYDVTFWIGRRGAHFTAPPIYGPTSLYDHEIEQHLSDFYMGAWSGRMIPDYK